MFTGADQLAVLNATALNATAQADLVPTGEVTAVELVETAIRPDRRAEPTLNAVIAATYDEALARAAASRPAG